MHEVHSKWTGICSGGHTEKPKGDEDRRVSVLEERCETRAIDSP